MSFVYLIFVFVLSFYIFGITFGSPIRLHKDKPSDDCVCDTYSCACCGTLLIPQIGIDKTFCLSVAFHPKEYGISLLIEIDDEPIIHETVSAKNPPPICVRLPLDLASACVRFTDLHISEGGTFHGCANLESRVLWIYRGSEVALGCWNARGTSPVELSSEKEALGDLALTAGRLFRKKHGKGSSKNKDAWGLFRKKHGKRGSKNKDAWRLFRKLFSFKGSPKNAVSSVHRMNPLLLFCCLAQCIFIWCLLG